MMRTRLLTADTLRSRESARLLAWALEHGADEFTVAVMAMQGIEAPLADAFEDALAPWAGAPGRRRVVHGWTEPDFTREVRLWRLTPLSLALLQEFLPAGLFSSDTQERGWFEDPALYRRGELLLGVVTHEREGVIRVSAEEEEELARLGVRLGDAEGWGALFGH